MVSSVETTSTPRWQAHKNAGSRKTFRNPRGLEYWYVLYHRTPTNTEIDYEYSTDGTTWSNTIGVVENSGGAQPYDGDFDVEIYDNGTSLTSPKG